MSDRSRRVADLVAVLIRRDLRVSYGRARLGLLWAPVTALVQVGVLTFLFQRVVPLDIPDYAVFVFSGIAMWQLLSGAVQRSTEAFTGNRDLVRRPGFPDILLPLVTVGGAIAGYLLALPVLAAALVATGRLRPSAVLLPPVVLVAALLVAGPAFAVATWNVSFHDVRHVVGAALGVLFYLTPVFYDVDLVPGRFRWVVDSNPFAVAVRLHRQVLYDGVAPDLSQLAFCAAVGALGSALGVAVHLRSAAHLADDL